MIDSPDLDAIPQEDGGTNPLIEHQLDYVRPGHFGQLGLEYLLSWWVMDFDMKTGVMIAGGKEQGERG